MAQLAFSFIAALSAFFLLADRHFRTALAWSVMWGLAIGAWTIAPRLLASHHVIPDTLGEWLIIDLFLLTAFGLIGALLGLAVNAPVAAYRFSTRHEPFNREWLGPLWTGLCLPFAYLAVSALIEWSNFNRLSGEPYWKPVSAFLGGHVTLIALCGLVFGAGVDPLIGTRRLLRALAAATMLAFIVLPARAPKLFYVPAKASPLTRVPAPHAPLLVVGLDGGNWRTLQPLINAGKLPTLARLVARGVSGDMNAAWPPYWSAPAWATMVTGYPPEATGVHEDISADIPGLPRLELPLAVDQLLNPMLALEASLVERGVIRPVPTPRSSLKRPPIWELVSKAGLKTVVVRFPFTYPAAGQADYVISNRVVNDLWDTMGVRIGDRDKLVFPAHDTDRMLTHFGPPDSADAAQLRALLSQTDWPKPANVFLNPVDVISRAVHVQRQMHEATRDILRRTPRVELTMLYVAGLDNLSHALWEFRHPEDFADDPPAPADVEVLGPVIDRYMEWFDVQLAELIATYPSEPNVIVVSDHGEGRTELSTIWRGWHTGKGIFIAGGPNVPAHTRGAQVSYQDVVPTILDLLGLRSHEPLSGHSVLAGQQN